MGVRGITNGRRINNKYVWLCAFYYLIEVIDYDSLMAENTLRACEQYQIEELAYRGYDRRRRNERFFETVMSWAEQ